MRCPPGTIAATVLLAGCIPAGSQPVTAVKAIGGAAALFVENQGQFDPAVKYKLTTPTGAIWLTATGVVFDGVRETPDGLRSLRLAAPGRIGLEASSPERLVFSERFVGSNPNAALEAGEPSAARWPAHVRAFSRVDYKDVWPGISVRLAASGIGIQQQFIIQPRANANSIAISYQGIDGMTIDDQGSLVISTVLGTLREGVPNVYQEVNGHRITEAGQYRLTGLATYGFQVDTYAREYPLVISPTLLGFSQSYGASIGLPVINFFDVAPAATLPGQAAIGTLSVSGATSATLNGIIANCSNGQCAGTVLFYPRSTTTYVLQASGAGGNVSASQQVEVGQYQPNPLSLPTGLQVTWQGACWLTHYPVSFCNGACQGMAFDVNIPTPPSALPLEATLYMGTTKCNPASQDNMNDLGTLTSSGGWIFWFTHHPNRKYTSAIWTIGNQSSGCVNYATAPACP